MRRTMRLMVGLAVIATLGAIAPGPAAVAGPREPDIPYFDDTTGPAVSVNGTYEPVVGRFTSLELDDILWYATGPATDYRWTPCPGCETGPFTSTKSALQVSGSYQPLVGDFAGDAHDDIFWFSTRGGADYLWTAGPSGSFTSVRRDMDDAYRSGDDRDFGPIVLPDTGSGKDDIVWTKISDAEEGERPQIRYALWVFPDDGSGAARTVARGDRPLGGPVVGDFDGNSVADIFWYAARSGCTCPTDGPAEMIDTYWRRSSSMHPGFTVTTQNVKGEYIPIPGRLSASDDTRSDILWEGAFNQSRGGYTEGPDSFWAGQTSGKFVASSVVLPPGSGDSSYAVPLGPGLVLEHAGPDTVLFPYFEKIWFQTESGPVLRDIGVDLPETSFFLVGRFTTSDRDDVFVYERGPKAEHLHHPID